MRRTTILNAKQVKRTSFSEAEQLFTKHCKLKNLSPQTMRYYAEDLKYFQACVPVQYVDEVSQDVFENFIVSELDAGKKITSLTICSSAWTAAISRACGGDPDGKLRLPRASGCADALAVSKNPGRSCGRDLRIFLTASAPAGAPAGRRILLCAFCGRF